MAYPDGYHGHYFTSTSPTRSSDEYQRLWSLSVERSIEEQDVVQGRIFWLPPKNNLPEKAVRRAHGKGAVEEGIYNHPVVVISRPAEDERIVHFHLITSFQGKKLHEMYGKSNDFHASRRSWYLPIAPTPDHPDANSKKSKRRFPTLQLAGGAVLRWDSYVNLRHVYKVNWALLRPYTSPDTPLNPHFQFDRETLDRMLAKGKMLTTYERGPQYHNPFPVQMQLDYCRKSEVQEVAEDNLPPSVAPSPSNSGRSGPPSPAQSDFLDSDQPMDGSIRPVPKVPPDRGDSETGFETIQYIFQHLFRWPWPVVRRLWTWIWA